LKKRILFILHLPPPVHGAGVVGEMIRQSQVINTSFDATYINLSTSNKVNEVGKGGLNKMGTTLKITGKVIKALLAKNYDLCYMTLTAKGLGYYKDLAIVLILKLFSKKIIYHFHNKGVSAKQHRTVDNLLYRFTFKNTKSILLSSLLYPDIENYVKKEDVSFCPNGIPSVESFKKLEVLPSKENKVCRLLFLSDMMIEKGVFVLLEACKVLMDRKPWHS
jgi:hypothetical protein